MGKHTPGEWIYAENGTIYADEYRKTIVRINGLGASLEDEANARLIAAAPDLLEACREIHKLWCCPEPNRMKDWSARCDVMSYYARKAIAKAEGER